ncbi:hypothetical protein ACWKYF_05220 [Enterobacter asburiae]
MKEWLQTGASFNPMSFSVTRGKRSAEKMPLVGASMSQIFSYSKVLLALRLWDNSTSRK